VNREPITPLTEAQIDELAIEIVTNVVYLPLEEEAMKCSFGAMIALAGPLPPNTGLVYEYWEAAGPRSVNGFPMFLSMKLIAQESVDALLDRCIAKDKALHGET
jgi:hypothetical protein